MTFWAKMLAGEAVHSVLQGRHATTAAMALRGAGEALVTTATNSRTSCFLFFKIEIFYHHGQQATKSLLNPKNSKNQQLTAKGRFSFNLLVGLIL